MLSTSRSRSLVTPALALLVLVGCTPEGSPDPGALSAAPEPGSTGTTGETDGGGEAPTTGAPTTGLDPTTGGTTGGTTGDEPGTSDSSGGTTDDGGPSLGGCTYDPPGVALALARTVQGLTTDLSARDCGTAEDWPALTVLAAAPDHLEVSLCDDAACGACDPDHTLTLDLTIPAPFPRLPKQLAPGDCLHLAARWDEPADGEPAACGLSSLAVVRRAAGVDEPVPRFMYRHASALPATDTIGDFALTGASAGPGALTCPCDGDCCLEPPGTRRVRFTAARDKWEVEVPPIEPGDVVAAFDLAVVEGDDLHATLGLVNARVPSACAAPQRHEWILHVAP
jgi:hypothetical protein